MPKSAAAVANNSNNLKKYFKSKPRYSEADNNLLFESWWHPQSRRELTKKLGREMNALRSQFCRLLKEKGLSNQEYYHMMQAKHLGENGVTTRKRCRESKAIDQIVLETFCKHQVLGNSRTQACQELREKLGMNFTPAALKLRFYRLVKVLQYNDEDLLKIGKQLLNQPVAEAENGPAVIETAQEKETGQREQGGNDRSFLYELSTMPEALHNIEERLAKVEESQRHQLDLKGFIEHLLAVERDIKREDKMMEEIQRLIQENESIRSALDKERERLKAREDELTGVYKMLDSTLTDFMRLESVSKLASLGDFMHRLEITVDQFGNVIRSKRVVS